MATTESNCPSNGSVIIASNIDGVAGATYELISGPQGAPINVPQSTGTFNALASGTYEVRLQCGGLYQDFSFTISDAYSEITQVNVTASATCGTFAPSGNISLNSVTGGSGTLRYKVVKTNDPNFPETSTGYTTINPSKFPISIPVTSYGIYQVRVIDGCQEYFTQTVNVQPTLDPVVITWAGIDRNNATCTQDSVHVFGFDLATMPALNVANKWQYFSQGGFKLSVWEQTGTTCPTTSTLSSLPAPLATITVTSDQFSIPLISSGKYIFRIVTPCGDTTVQCSDISSQLIPGVWGSVLASGCVGNPTNPALMTITGGVRFLNFPAKVVAINSSNTRVDSVVINANEYTIADLPLDNYTLEVTDFCNATVSTVINQPNTAAAPAIQYVWGLGWKCFPGGGGLTQEGTRQAEVKLTGHIPDLQNATVTIVGGPGSIGQVGLEHPTDPSIYYFNNLLPAPASNPYQIRIVTGCFEDTLDFAFNPSASQLLKQDLFIDAQSFCSGGGTITATTNYNGSYGTQ